VPNQTAVVHSIGLPGVQADGSRQRVQLKAVHSSSLPSFVVKAQTSSIACLAL